MKKQTTEKENWTRTQATYQQAKHPPTDLIKAIISRMIKTGWTTLPTMIHDSITKIDQKRQLGNQNTYSPFCVATCT